MLGKPRRDAGHLQGGEKKYFVNLLLCINVII